MLCLSQGRPDLAYVLYSLTNNERIPPLVVVDQITAPLGPQEVPIHEARCVHGVGPPWRGAFPVGVGLRKAAAVGVAAALQYRRFAAMRWGAGIGPSGSSGYIPGKSYLRPAVVRSVDASKGRREAQEREPYGWLVWGSGLMRIIFPGSDACWVFLLDFCPPSHLTHVYVYIYTFLHLLPSGAA